MSKNKSIKWAKITGKYVGIPYKLGGWSKDGMDCLSLSISILRDLGKKIPADEEMDGINLNNYPEYWNKYPNKAKNILINYLKTITHKVDKGQLRVGDFIVATLKQGSQPFIGIYTGSDRLLTATIKGITTYRLYNYTILEVYRP